MIRHTDFTEPLMPPWRITQLGRGVVTPAPGALRLAVPPTPANTYSDAQITDYAGKRDFVWRPPLRMTVTAHMDIAFVGEGLKPSLTEMCGTAGFGFWNHPFVPGERGLRLPQVVWFFFSSPPSNMQLATDVPGPGWKAATLDATRWQFLALAPIAPVGFLLMRVPALYRRLWPVGQRAVGVSEHLLDTSLLAEKHTYSLDWRPETITFAVDGKTVHQTPSAPRGPLGFIAWIDNQYAVVTPKGQFGWGLLPVEREQALILEQVRIENI
jgi:hypothetical protein